MVEIISNAKFRTDQITVYDQFIFDSVPSRKINDWEEDRTYFINDKVKYLEKCYVSKKDFNKNNDPEKYVEHWKLWELHSHGFSREAKKRFAAALDNFTGIFESCKYLDKSTLVYNHTGPGGMSERKPSFCTLTIPSQNNKSDYNIKQKCLKRFLNNIIQRTDIKFYIWKAEAQLRGEIHFHIAFDKYIHQERAKRNWYKILKENNLHNNIKFENASRIVWVNSFQSIDTIKFELSGYFATEEIPGDPEHYVYKHDPTKKVRKINGNQWGCSDVLKYEALQWKNIAQDHDDLIKSNPLFSKTVKDKQEREVATVHIYKQVKVSRKKAPGKPARKYTIKNKMHEFIGAQMVCWHYLHAAAIYEDTSRKLEKKEFDLLFNNNWLKVNSPTQFIKQVPGTETHKPNYEAYKNFIGKWWI